MKKQLFIALFVLCMAFILLPGVALAAEDNYVAKIGETGYASLQDAVDVAEGQTVTLLKDIELWDMLTADGNITLDLNGKTIKENAYAGGAYYLGMIAHYEGTLKVIDSKGGGKIIGKYTAFYLSSDGDLEIAGGLVTKMNSQGNTILHNSEGKVTVSGGVVEAESNCAILIRCGGTVEVTGGKVHSTWGQAIRFLESDGHVIVSGGEVSAGGYKNSVPIYNDDNYGKITISGGLVSNGVAEAICDKSQRGVITLSGGRVEGFITAAPQGKIAITGDVVIDGTIKNNEPDLSGIDGEYEWRTSKEGSFTPSTEKPYTWKPTHKYLEIKKISRVETVSNMLGNIWLSGGGFQFDDMLNTKTLSSGSNYDAMMQLKEQNDSSGITGVIAVYALSLNSGMKSTGNDMYVNFKLPNPAEYAGQMLTLVYKKGDAYEYFYANADAEGRVQFGPIRELSTVMLVKGMLPNEPMNVEEMNTQAGGVFEMYVFGISVWWFIGIGAALVISAGVVVAIVLRRRKKRQG